ncbi:MAG: CapA family protein [Chloroflexi bacterium]|nr:CapA family protein [Chloroflexota bacterium]
MEKKSEMTLALAGESIINRRLSVHTEERFLSLINLLREADVAYTHLETLIHDYDGPEVYPAALSGYTWMRSPRFVADELRWAGFHLVSLAHNHVMDYSCGGLFSTQEVLNRAGVVHAGTGRNLGEAREPAYLDTAKGRVALVSMCSSNTYSARAGEARRDVKGRPGLNPLRFHYVADPDTIETLKQLAFKVGWHIAKTAKEWLFYPPGSAHLIFKFVEGEKPGVSTVADEDDAEANLRSVRDAARQADCVLVHLHSHDWDPDKGPDFPATYMPPFARACLDAGGHVFLSDGREPPKGIEIYKGKPIFYGRGEFAGMARTVTKLPADFYWRPGYQPEVRRWEATMGDAMDARDALPPPLNPPDHHPSHLAGPMGMVALCSLGDDSRLTRLELYPVTLVRKPRSRNGLPMLADGETGERIIAHLGELSAPFGTKIEYRDGKGFVDLM